MLLTLSGLMIVAVVGVFEPRPIAMFLSLSIRYHYKPYYVTCVFLLSSVGFYYAVFLVVILMVIVRVIMLVIPSSSLTCSHLSYKIRFEVPERQRGREMEIAKMLQRLFSYKSIQYWIEKSTTKAIALVDKICYMLQIQLVNALGKHIDTEYPVFTRYSGTSFQFIAWILIFDIVTIKRNSAVLERYENNHCIMLTSKLLRSCI